METLTNEAPDVGLKEKHVQKSKQKNKSCFVYPESSNFFEPAASPTKNPKIFGYAKLEIDDEIKRLYADVL